MLIFTALPWIFFKTHIFWLYNISKKIRDVTVSPPHENLIPEIKGFLWFGKVRITGTIGISCSLIADFLLLSTFVSCTSSGFIGRVSSVPAKFGGCTWCSNTLQNCHSQRFLCRLWGQALILCSSWIPYIWYLTFGLIMVGQLLFRVFMFSRPFVCECVILSIWHQLVVSIIVWGWLTSCIPTENLVDITIVLV